MTLKNIVVDTERQLPVHQRRIEVVERKGVGHPDYLADSIVERFSRLLCKEYLQSCGQVLHHNVDKLEIVGGQTRTKFGGGRFEQPVLVFFSGRATDTFENNFFNISEIAKNSAVKVIEETFCGKYVGESRPLWDPKDEHQTTFLVHTKGGKSLLKKALMDFPPRANDSSIGSGYAPVSWAERAVFEAERFVNSTKFKERYPSSGTDVKVTGRRTNRVLSVTVAMAFIDRFISGIREYVEQKSRIKKEIQDHLSKFLPSDKESIGSVSLNLLDDEEAARRAERIQKDAEEHVYLTVTGSSVEHSDDGTVGRSNRAMGVSAFNRPLSIGAIAGKNPIGHTQKLYTILAFLTAREIYSEVRDSGVEEVYVTMATDIGRRTTNPRLTYVRMLSSKRVRIQKAIIEEIVESQIETELGKEISLGQCKLSRDIIEGRHQLF